MIFIEIFKTLKNMFNCELIDWVFIVFGRIIACLYIDIIFFVKYKIC